ncbi:histidine kinase [Kordiimonas sediminis]|uniref:histidine kinase n=1 Tax=Kordiimonas sediminis TaxID=1735581 RepID=A0A919ANL9_9PROT|nr:histidine kinase [Kordiimonas sediminis]
MVTETSKSTRGYDEGARQAPLRLLSPLMFRILAVNAMALLILVGGVLYLGQFRDNLIAQRVESLQVQAEIIAGALGETTPEGPEATDIDIALARPIITRLVGPTENRARLFSVSGTMVADSRLLAGHKRVVAEPLQTPMSERPFGEQIQNYIYEFLDMFTRRPEMPPNVDKPGMRAVDFLEVATALEGEAMTQLRVRDDGRAVINVAVPIQRFRRVLGALLLTAQTEDIEAVVRAEQMSTVKIFAAAMAVTMLLSFFLGRTIVRPIGILARAAERVRRGIGREESLPEFSERNDEIGDLSRSLSEMTTALYNQIDAVERFAADVAHELKNPLSSMRSALETLQNSDRQDVRDKLMPILVEDVKRLDRLITDISDASRLDAELTRGQMDPIDLGIMIAMLVDGYKTIDLPEGRSVTCEDFEAGVYMVQGIDGRLGQVWRNLIDNALSFSPQNGTVTITLAKDGKYIVTEVTDQGIGIPEGAEEKIFRRFYSERPEQEAFGGHSGLGLAISKQVVEAHGGSVTASNVLNDDGAVCGACFRVRLPAL